MSTASILSLVRADLQAFAGYSSARSSALTGDVWLNANESAWANPAVWTCRRFRRSRSSYRRR